MEDLLRKGALACAVTLAALVYVHPAGAAESKAAGTVDINSASIKDLEALPGVGAATAKKIVAGRPYVTVGDLAKAGVSKATIAKITPLVTVTPAQAAPAATPRAAAAPKAPKASAAPPGPVDLNTASEKDLEALPGVGPATAKKIIAGRPYASVADLSKAGVSASTIQKVGGLAVVSAATAPAAAPAAIPPVAAAPTPRPPVTAAAPPAATAPAAPRTAAVPPAAAASPTTARTPPAKGMVWVNTSSKVFHREGDRWYGTTKQGKFMTEADALAAGYREAKSEGKKKTDQ